MSNCTKVNVKLTGTRGQLTETDDNLANIGNRPEIAKILNPSGYFRDAND